MKAQPGAMMETHSGAIEAHPGAMDARPVHIVATAAGTCETVGITDSTVKLSCNDFWGVVPAFPEFCDIFLCISATIATIRKILTQFFKDNRDTGNIRLLVFLTVHEYLTFLFDEN
jgi:hypothetical protein